MRILDKINKKIKGIFNHQKIDDFMWFSIIMFVGLSSFFAGIFYQQNIYREKNPITIEYSQESVELWNNYQNLKNANTEYFASKNGSVVYPVGCTKGDRIKDENKIFFTGINQALELGYREVEGC